MRGEKMKKYDSPVIEITEISASDVITTSTGDTPFATFEW